MSKAGLTVGLVHLWSNLHSATMQINLVQLDIAWESPAENYARIDALLGSALPEAGSLVVLPEMFATGFSLNRHSHDYTGIESPDIYLSRTAKRLKCWVAGGAAILGPDKNFRNQQLLINPSGECVARYSKMRLFHHGGEERMCQAGMEVVVASLEKWKVAPLVCYDLRFPELFREGVKRGAELFIVIANWPSIRSEHWITLLRARAIENQAYVIGVNRCGRDPEHEYSGHSVVIDSKGNVLLDAGDAETIAQTKLDRMDMLSWREEFPVMRDI
ncbi:MAG: nitrilase-related carbon-nitrogen hydrolase [Chthoniobacterales bacterium]